MNYLPIEQAATNADVPLDRVMKLIKAGLLKPVQKGNFVFLSSQEVYKLRFILYLQREHHLRLAEIDRILQTHEPPYTDWRSSVAAVQQR